MDTIKYAKYECKRQHDRDGVPSMLLALDYARDHKDTLPTEDDAIMIAYYVKAHEGMNLIGATNNYRHTPITVNGFVTGSKPTEIARQMMLLFKQLQFLPTTDPWSDTEQEIDSWIKRLLDIHPWIDGNGRAASILRNWFLGTLDEPTPLPLYYGDR